MIRLLAASLLALSLVLACGSSPQGSADLGPEVPDGESPADATEVDVGIDAEPDIGADADRESVDDVCDLTCPDWQHCEWADDGMACVDYACDPGCAIGTRCEAGECRPYCDKACDAGTYCKWTTGDEPFMTCTNLCEPACPVTQHCEQGACVANVCAEPCGPWTYCGPAGECVCDCSGEPLEPICGRGDQGSGTFVLYDNACELACAGAIVADCALVVVVPPQPVCDVASYLANPAADSTYDNVCYAACAGVPIESLVAGPCTCSMTCTEAELGAGPVCGLDCLDYANPCDARCAGVGVQYPHPCPVGCGCCGTCADCANDPCPDPVCGKDGNTYDSLCILEVCHAGVGVAYAGFCVPDDACDCPSTSAPVCGSLPGEEGWQTIPNGCTATCLDATVWFEGVCSCCDPSVDAPVCAYTSLVGWTAMRNQCVVDSLGYYTATYPGACVCCGAPGSVDGCCDLNDPAPVCGADGVTYANDCALTCAGVAKKNDGACLCSAAYEPVCGESLLTPGKLQTYPNACVAQSLYGITATTPGACPPCTTACAGEDPEPICGLDGVTYPNWCALLKCNGDAVTKGLADARCNAACESCP